MIRLSERPPFASGTGCLLSRSGLGSANREPRRRCQTYPTSGRSQISSTPSAVTFRNLKVHMEVENFLRWAALWVSKSAQRRRNHGFSSVRLQSAGRCWEGELPIRGAPNGSDGTNGSNGTNGTLRGRGAPHSLHTRSNANETGPWRRSTPRAGSSSQFVK